MQHRKEVIQVASCGIEGRIIFVFALNRLFYFYTFLQTYVCSSSILLLSLSALIHSPDSLSLSLYFRFCNKPVWEGSSVLSVIYLLPAIFSSGEEKAQTFALAQAVSQV